MKYEKLVRDRIPDLIASDGRAADYRVATIAERDSFLLRKLFEECREVIDAVRAGDPTQLREELADVLEAIEGIGQIHGIDARSIRDAADAKRVARGGFLAQHLLGTEAGRSGRLFSGRGDDFLHAIKRELSRCVRVSIAVAFAMRSGIDLLEGALRSAVGRGAMFRLLTTDYLGVTEPEALRRLLAAVGSARVRLYQADRLAFHPKVWIFEHPDGSGRAFIGSSNLSRSALLTGIEWNWMALDVDLTNGLAELLAEFETLYSDPRSAPLSSDLIAAYDERRPFLAAASEKLEPADAISTLRPNPAQQAALVELDRFRSDGESRALVIAATGVGKTFLAAFDSAAYQSVLFVAHREELLLQAERSFRIVRPGLDTGFAVAGRFEVDAALVFGSVQTLSRPESLSRLPPDRFDYIVIDEFHHAAADSYKALLEHFRPRFLLGLTATPYRGDNRDLVGLCDGNIAYRVGVFEAISFGWLVPFKYWGIADVVTYTPELLNASRTAYDTTRLTIAYNTNERAEKVLENYRAHASTAALGFCVSIDHARFMAEQFDKAGVRSLAVHSGPDSADRTEAIERLTRGDVRVLFTVDLFNEGVDIPCVDLVMFLRPTESMTVFLQQLGRGLRRHGEAKQWLTVLDFIGNYRKAHYKLPFLAGIEDDSPESQRRALELLRSGNVRESLPPGVEVTLEPVSLDALQESLSQAGSLRTQLAGAFSEVHQVLGRRPTLLEIERRGRFGAGRYRQTFGSWYRALAALGSLSEAEQSLESEVGEFLRELETTSMTKSYKMVVLLAMLGHGGFSRPLPLQAINGAFRAFFAKDAHRGDILGTAVEAIETAADTVLDNYILSNPINAWIGGNTGQASSWFRFDESDNALRYIGPSSADPVALDAAVRERVQWRLATYFDRQQRGDRLFSVIPAGSDRTRVCIMLGEKPRTGPVELPRSEGWKLVRINGRYLHAKFVKVAINVLKERPVDGDAEPNLLTQELTILLGPRLLAFEKRYRVRIVKLPQEDAWVIEAA